jgi:O-antigen/teichoic acid export membrane protein
LGIIQRQGIINSIITYTGIIIGALNLIFFQPVFLSKEEIGLIRVLFSFSALIGSFVPLGMTSITLKFFPLFRNREQRHYGYFGLMLFLPMVGFAVTSAGLWIFKPFIAAQYNTQSPLFNDYFNYVFPLILFTALSSVFAGYCYSIFKTSVPAFLNDVFTKVISIILFGVYFLQWITLPQFIFLFVAIYGIQTVFLALYIFRVDSPGFRVDFGFLSGQNPKSMLKYGLLLSFTALSSLGLKYIDVVMLGKYLPLAYVGIYSIAAFMPTVIEAPLGALEKIGVAKIAEAWSNKDFNEVRKIYFQSSRYLFLAGCLLFLGVNLNTHALYQMLPDKDYSLGESVVLIISIGTLINMATGINDAIVYTSDKYIYGTYMLLVLFVLAIANNYFLIPLFGMNGAALATVISATVFNVMKFLFIWVNFKIQPFDNRTVRILLTLIITWSACYFIPSIGHPVIQIIYRSTAILIVFLTCVKVFNIVPELEQQVLSRLRK